MSHADADADADPGPHSVPDSGPGPVHPARALWRLFEPPSAALAGRSGRPRWATETHAV